MPSILEAGHEIGGKFLLGICQAISIVSMAASRRAAANQGAKALGPVAAGAGAGHGHSGGVLVGQPVLGPSTQELQQQIVQLQHQVRELTRLVQAPPSCPPAGKAVVASSTELLPLCSSAQVGVAPALL